LETQPQFNNLQTKNPTPTQQSTNWKPNLNPNNIQIGNPNTTELEINPTICNLENPIDCNLETPKICKLHNLNLQHFENSTTNHTHTIEVLKRLGCFTFFFFIIEALCPLGFGYLHIQQTIETFATKKGQSTIRVSIQAS